VKDFWHRIPRIRLRFYYRPGERLSYACAGIAHTDMVVYVDACDLRLAEHINYTQESIRVSYTEHRGAAESGHL
jgi:hypothetical protein